MSDILERPPDEEEGDDQDAREGAESETVTVVDFQNADELEEDDVEDGDDDA